MKVRTNSIYRFVPCGWDIIFPQHYQAKAGQLVRVVKLPGGMPPNTMRQANVADPETGEVLGMVSTHSLLPRKGGKAS